MQMYAIQDTKADVFLRPFFHMNEAEALRGFEIIANDGENMISKFPNDFRLYHLGEFSTVDGSMSLLPKPKSLGTATSFKAGTNGAISISRKKKA